MLKIFFWYIFSYLNVSTTSNVSSYPFDSLFVVLIEAKFPLLLVFFFLVCLLAVLGLTNVFVDCWHSCLSVRQNCCYDSHLVPWCFSLSCSWFLWDHLCSTKSLIHRGCLDASTISLWKRSMFWVTLSPSVDLQERSDAPLTNLQVSSILMISCSYCDWVFWS